jgi:hypothetical protein
MFNQFYQVMSVGRSKWIDLPETIRCYDAETQLQQARDWIYPDVNNCDAVIISALVAVTNKQVDEHNDYFLSKVMGKNRIMESTDQILSDMPTDVKYIIADFTDTMPHNKMPPSKLLLKVNGIYACMRTINFARKLMNGTVVRVVSMTNKYSSTSQSRTIPRDLKMTFLGLPSRRTSIRTLHSKFQDINFRSVLDTP